MRREVLKRWGAPVLGSWLCVVAAAQGLSADSFSPVEPGSEEPGWSGPWSSAADLGSPAALVIDPQASLPTPVGFAPAATGGRVTSFTGVMYRGLALGEELNFTDHQTFYMQLVVRRTAADADGTSRAFSILLHDKLNRVLTLGCSGSGKLSIQGDGVNAVSEKPANALDHHYVWVIRFDPPDEGGKRVIRFLSFHESQKMADAEPTQWSLVTDPVKLDATVDRIGLAAGKHILADFDELRIARSWAELRGVN